MDKGSPVTAQPGYPGYPPVPGVLPTPGQTFVQPGALPAQVDQWMVRPDVSDCPLGLEYLTQIDQLIVKQQVELFEVITRWETKNKYKILNSLGQQVYYAEEDSGCCMRQCCGPARGFVINITDNLGQPVMTVERKFKCCAGCCWCACSNYCAFNVIVRDRAGNYLGKVKQGCSFWKPKYTIFTEGDEVVGDINGPCCVCNCSCCGDVEFPITSPRTGDKIGQVAKQWTGFAKEVFTDADTFCVTFPVDMDVKTKATFIGACFLIVSLYRLVFKYCR